MTAAATQPQAATKGRFGTFTGVFTPNVLTILGIILFLRTGVVVGEAGLLGAIVIVLLANAITTLTGLSLSAISTSMDVGTGGNYYMISRSLGLEIGGAIGIPLYLSQAISVAFYVLGFTEAFLAMEAFSDLDPKLVASAVMAVFVVLAFVGADIALRVQYIVFAVLMLAVASFFLGGWGAGLQPTLLPRFSEDQTFWTIFALFFPAVTGITVGASMSGDLRDPRRSIPIGTLGAIVFTAAVYIAAVVWLSLHATPEELKSDPLIMARIARWPLLIFAGVWAASLSSALGSVLAAPRTLQALAMDRVLPHGLSAQLGSRTEPRVAVLITAVIGFVVIWLGDLNLVAPVISMFFLNTYGMTNVAHAVEELVGNPSYRPQVRISWAWALLGAAGSYGVMFLINPWATVVAIVVSYGIYFVLSRRALGRGWGDLRSGYWFALARFALLRHEAVPWHPRNWRPNILVFTGQPHNREELVALADWLTQGRGIVTFIHLLVGGTEALTAGRQVRERARQRIRAYIQARGMRAFAEVDVVSDFHKGALAVSQAHGIGGLEPNAVLLGWSRTPEGRAGQFELMRGLASLGKSIFVLSGAEKATGEHRLLDVWWRGRGGNADLMLLVAHIISRHPTWSRSRIRLLRAIDGEEGREQTRAHMQALLREVRVRAEPVVIVRSGPEHSIFDIFREWSGDSDLTLLGVNLPEAADVPRYAESLSRALENVGAALLIHGIQQEGLLHADEAGGAEAGGREAGAARPIPG